MLKIPSRSVREGFFLSDLILSSLTYDSMPASLASLCEIYH